MSSSGERWVPALRRLARRLGLFRCARQASIALRRVSPSLYRLIRYGRLNVNTQDHWDTVWSPEESIATRLYPELFGRIAELVPKGANVLDVGCGRGVLLARLRDECGCTGTGTDISPVAIEAVRSRGFEAIVCALPRVPFEDEAFDCVLATEVLEHLSRVRSSLLEMRRVLKSGGTLFVSVPDRIFAPFHHPEHMRAFDADSLRAELSACFEVRLMERINMNGNHHLLAAADKRPRDDAHPDRRP